MPRSGPRETRQDSYARAARAARLRAAGRTWAEIAASEGYQTRSGAQLAVRRHYAREAGGLDDQRHNAADGLRIVKSVLFATMSGASQRGDDTTVIAAARAIMDNIGRDAALNGLNVPVAQRVDVQVEHSAATILERAERDLLALAADRQRQLPGGVIDAEIVREDTA